MKQSIIDTDILSEFLKGNEKVIAAIDEYLNEFNLEVSPLLLTMRF
jgi:predicted nucleic-acid-binding protein